MVSAATSSFFFHKENLQLQRASYDFPPILITVTFQVPTAGVCVCECVCDSLPAKFAVLTKRVHPDTRTHTRTTGGKVGINPSSCG